MNLQRYMIKSYLITVIVLGVLCGACSDEWLDQKPTKNASVPSTIEDFERLMDNSTVINYSSPGLGEVASDYYYIKENVWQGSLSDAQRNAYTWSHDRQYLSVNDWDNAFSRIFYCNVVLEGLEKIDVTDENRTQYNSVKGNALFQRGRTFFELAQVFCPPYVKATAATELGLPLRVISDITKPSVRSTLEQTYSQMIADLKEAAELSPKTPNLQKSRSSRPAAYALLAKVYLSMDDFNSAGTYAEEALNDYNLLMNFDTDLSKTDAAPILRFNNEHIFHSAMTLYRTIVINSLIDNDIYTSYDNNDLRKTLYCRLNADGLVIFKGNTGALGTVLFCGITTAELYLIAAECYARVGQKDLAMARLNTLLKTRWISDTYTDLTAATPADALVLVLQERKKELLFRGVRWHDMRRLNKVAGTGTTITRTIGGTTYTLEPGSHKYTFPIPDDVIMQTGMPQNKGW